MAELRNMEQADIARCEEIYRSAFDVEEVYGFETFSPEGEL